MSDIEEDNVIEQLEEIEEEEIGMKSHDNLDANHVDERAEDSPSADSHTAAAVHKALEIQSPEPAEQSEELQGSAFDRDISAHIVTETDDGIPDPEATPVMKINTLSFEENVSSPTDSDGGHRKESIDDLRQWIRRTSSRVKSFSHKPGERTNSFNGGNGSPMLSPKTPGTPLGGPTGSVGSPRPLLASPAAPASPIPSSRPPRGPAGSAVPIQSISIAYSELVRRNTVKEYDGLKQSQLESYLTAEEFNTVFSKTKEEYYAQPAWKQAAQKKKALLF